MTELPDWPGWKFYKNPEELDKDIKEDFKKKSVDEKLEIMFSLLVDMWSWMAIKEENKK